MLNQISQYIKQTIHDFPDQDSLILNNHLHQINQTNFHSISAQAEGKSITFIDGGQAEILSTGNFCLSFIRVAAITFKDNKKVKYFKNEFYLFTKASYRENEIYYESKLFTKENPLINETDLFISSNDTTIKNGTERAPISKSSSMARRFAELALAGMIDSDFIILDGTLEKTFSQEEKYLNKLSPKVSALAKTSSLFTGSGNSPTILLNKIGPGGAWRYDLNPQTCFVKLHPTSKHVFRFEGNKEILPYLISNSADALFLGYPYGLILADKLARVTNQEKTALTARFLLNKQNNELMGYLATNDAHQILDRIG